MDRVDVWLRRAAVFVTAAWLAFAYEAAAEVRCPLTGCPVGVPGSPPAGATGIEWCAEYVETPLAPTCITTGIVAQHTFDGLDAARYDLRYRWLPTGEWSDALGGLMETIPEDVTGDGFVGAPDFRAVIECAGVDVRTGDGCPE